jgi:glycosyltransferase involved in cell wall biosynthesis
LADTLHRWSDEPQTVTEMGARARQMLETQFTRRESIARWNRLFDRLAGRTVEST